MTNLEIILAETLKEGHTVPVVKAHNLAVNFAGYSMPEQVSNALDEGNFTISGKQSLLLQNDQTVVTDMKKKEVRLAELEIIIPKLKGEEKIAAEAEFAIWNGFLNTVKNALDTALKAQYNLENPSA